MSISTKFIMFRVTRSEAIIPSAKGFTLIELLVVVTIIAILSIIGLVVFTNIQKGARDAQRKADINSIASAYEATYNGQDGTYRALSASDFQSGKMPAPPGAPAGGSYNFTAGPNRDPLDIDRYQVCARLGDVADACTGSSTGCYCRSSSQSVTSASGVSCEKFKINGAPQYPGVGASQVCFTRVITAAGSYSSAILSDIWVKCDGSNGISGSITNCTTTKRASCTSDESRVGRTGNMDYYASMANATAGTPGTPSGLQIEVASYACTRTTLPDGSVTQDYWPGTTNVHLF